MSYKLSYHHSLYITMRVVDKVRIGSSLSNRSAVFPYESGNLVGLVIQFRTEARRLESGYTHAIVVAKNLVDEMLWVELPNGQRQIFDLDPISISQAAQFIESKLQEFDSLPEIPDREVIRT